MADYKLTPLPVEMGDSVKILLGLATANKPTLHATLHAAWDLEGYIINVLSPHGEEGDGGDLTRAFEHHTPRQLSESEFHAELGKLEQAVHNKTRAVNAAQGVDLGSVLLTLAPLIADLLGRLFKKKA